MSILTITVNHTDPIQAQQKVHRRLHPAGEVPPEGLVFQVASPADPGYQVICVWDSLRSFARFRDERLRPALEAEGVPSEHLTTTVFEVASYLAGSAAAAAPSAAVSA